MLSIFFSKKVKGFSGISKKDAVIVIPVYRHFSQLEQEEKIGLISAFKHFSNYSFVFIGPESLEKQDYLDYAAENQVSSVFYLFDNKYFSGKDTYSQLLVSKFFYQKFSNYKFMLIFQTDAFVFQNDLQKWIKTGYTYIGAPWVKRDFNGKVIITGSGNGGFSLRKIDDFIKLANRIETLQVLNCVWKKNKILIKIPFGIFMRIVAAPLWLKCSINKFTFYLSENKIQNEDRYWCEWVSEVFKDFKNAPPRLSACFAFEEEPKYLMNELAGMLPMGCHAWTINDPEFWKKYIYK